MTKSLRVIQFTDTHVYKDSAERMRGVDTYETFRETARLAFSKEGKPDFVLLTGDISMDETAESYDRVREIVEPLGVPTYFLPGNHDRFDIMQERFLSHRQVLNQDRNRDYLQVLNQDRNQDHRKVLNQDRNQDYRHSQQHDELQPQTQTQSGSQGHDPHLAPTEPTNIQPDRSFVKENWLFILLNSVVPGKVEGRLGEDELARLDAELRAHGDKHALVCMHHNITPISLDPTTDMGIQNVPEFYDVIDRHKNVKGVLWGHVHGEYFIKRFDIPYMATPSTCVQFRPVPEGIAVDPKPPGYRFLLLNPDGSIETRVERTACVPLGLQIEKPQPIE